MKHKGLLIIVAVALLCMQACTKDAVVQPSKITVVGKWQMTRHDLKFVKNGVQTDEIVESNYSKEDFEQYFADGSGYQSTHSTTQGASLNSFSYTLKDNILTLFINGRPGFAETITRLTETEFAIHSETVVPDLFGENQFHTEIDDYAFTRASL